MPGKTKTFTVTDAADVAVTVDTVTGRVTVAEDSSVVGWPTSAYLVKKPDSGATALQRPAGAKYSFEKSGGRLYSPGEVAGYVRLAAGGGSTTFQHDELGV